MIKLELKTVFTISGLSKKDIKGSKSIVEKTYYSRIRAELKEYQKLLAMSQEQLNDIQTLSQPEFNKKWPYELGDKSKDTHAAAEFTQRYTNEVTRYTKNIQELEDFLRNPMPINNWLLWFVYEGRPIKVFGKLAKTLYDIISDGNEYTTTGEMINNGNSLEIVSFEVENERTEDYA